MQTHTPLEIKVIHHMRNKGLPRTHHVGRPTALGNPYTHYNVSLPTDIKVSNAQEAVLAYQDFMNKGLEEDTLDDQVVDALLAIIEDAKQGGTIHLSCWCKSEVTPFESDYPLCHADVIRNLILDELEAEKYHDPN